jgi:hypothetical protein
MMKKPEVKKNKNGQNGKKKGPHKKQGGAKQQHAEGADLLRY